MATVLRDDQYFPIQGFYGSTWRKDVTQAGGGTLIEHSIHDVDVLRWLLDDDYVSGDHASLARHSGGEWVVTDLGSTNGTFVNEVRVVTPTVVTAADSLRIGRTQMRLET